MKKRLRIVEVSNGYLVTDETITNGPMFEPNSNAVTVYQTVEQLAAALPQLLATNPAVEQVIEGRYL